MYISIIMNFMIACQVLTTCCSLSRAIIDSLMNRASFCGYLRACYTVYRHIMLETLPFVMAREEGALSARYYM